MCFGLNIIKLFMKVFMNGTALTIKVWNQAQINTEILPLKLFHKQPFIRLLDYCFFFLEKQSELNNVRWMKKGEQIEEYQTTRYVFMDTHTQSERDWVKSKSLKLLRGDTFSPLIHWHSVPYYLVGAERISVCVDGNGKKTMRACIVIRINIEQV